MLTAAAGSPENPLPRRAARILLVDAKDRVLMFRGTDPGRPGSRYWFTAGGGIDPGESVEEGAVRELREETGLSVHPGTLGEPVRTEVTDFPYDGRWYRQEQQFFLVRVHSWDVTMAGFDVEEQRSIDDYRWWTVDELETTTEKFYPVDLAGLLREMVGR